MVSAMKLPDNVRAYFRKQGKIGAAKRKAMLTSERRTEIARKAALTRWASYSDKTGAKSAGSKKGTK